MAETREGEPIVDDSFLVLFNAWRDALTFRLPPARFGRRWALELSTAEPELEAGAWEVPVRAEVEVRAALAAAASPRRLTLRRHRSCRGRIEWPPRTATPGAHHEMQRFSRARGLRAGAGRLGRRRRRTSGSSRTESPCPVPRGGTTMQARCSSCSPGRRRPSAAVASALPFRARPRCARSPSTHRVVTVDLGSALRRRPRRRRSRNASVSSSAPFAASPASAASGCSSRAACRSGSSPATTSAGRWRPRSNRPAAAADDPRHPAASSSTSASWRRRG